MELISIIPSREPLQLPCNAVLEVSPSSLKGQPDLGPHEKPSIRTPTKRPVYSVYASANPPKSSQDMSSNIGDPELWTPLLPHIEVTSDGQVRHPQRQPSSKISAKNSPISKELQRWLRPVTNMDENSHIRCGNGDDPGGHTCSTWERS